MQPKYISGYKTVNGLNMYYEIYGAGAPLVLIHGGGSTIQSNYGLVLPMFARYRQVIAVELQAHGHTADIDRPTSFEQDADDIVSLLKQLNIPNADFFGFSNGGSTALQIGIRHPQFVRKLIVASAIYKRAGMPPQFWDFMMSASIDNMPQPLKDAYLAINPNPAALKIMHDRDAVRMQNFVDWPDESISTIKAPTMIINGDKDIVQVEHALEIHRLLPQSRLLILPSGHGDYIGEVFSAIPGSKLPEYTVAIVEAFLTEQ